MEISSGNELNQTDLVTTDTGTPITQQTNAGQPSQDQGRAPLPRPQRRKRRDKADRGLPHDDELAKLAKAFTERQRKLWAKLAEAGLFPEATPEKLAAMVEDFKRRHRTGKVDLDEIQQFSKSSSKLGGSYNRFSCENSSPMSVLDQLVNSLDKAHSEGRLVPWQYVFADYSVTGLDATRQGYTSYKKLLSDEKQFIETTYIDDFTRASRDALEWWKLAALSKRLNKRMIGASDGFDLSSPDWDIKVTIYGLLSRLFIKGLREKVRRGMRGAARRGTCLGKLGLGFTRRPFFDENGSPVLDQDGRPVYEPCIDPMTCEARLLLYQLFVEQSLSFYQIVREFNRRKIDGWNGWSEGGIKCLLHCPDAIGVFIWNKGHDEYDPDSDKWVKIKHPHSEWQVRYVPELAIIPITMFRAARRKLAAMRSASPLTGRKTSRNQVSATTLFSGTLFCEHCGEEIKLCRSTDKYKQMACLNGLKGAHDCKLSVSKSTAIVEKSLLDYMRNTILTDAQMELLVKRANDRLAEESQKPKVDTKPWKAEVRKLEVKIKRLVIVMENEEDQALCVAQNARVKELQKEVNLLTTKIRDAESVIHKKVKPLTKDKAAEYLDSLRQTLNADIPIAAEAIRAITGPIKIRQEEVKGQTRKRWIATFSPNLMRAIRFLAAGGGGSANESKEENVEVETIELPLEKIPRYEVLAPLFKRLHEKGTSIQTLASAHGMSWQYASDILEFARTGVRPKWKSGKRTGNGRSGEKDNKFIELSPQVLELRDKKKWSFERIAKELKVGGSTVRRAYDHGHPESVRNAAVAGKTPDRGKYSYLGEDKYEQIRKLLRKGVKPTDVATQLGCGKSTVHRVKQKLKLQNGDAA